MENKNYYLVIQIITCQKQFATDSGQRRVYYVSNIFLGGYDLLDEIRLIFVVKDNYSSE